MKKEKFIKIGFIAGNVTLTSEGLNPAEVLGLLRLYEQKISLEILQNMVQQDMQDVQDKKI